MSVIIELKRRYSINSSVGPVPVVVPEQESHFQPLSMTDL